MVHHTDKLEANIREGAVPVYTLPASADFMCYSVKGYYSHQETVNGSWYIQDLGEILGKFGSSFEFTELLTLVHRKVSQHQVDFCKDLVQLERSRSPALAPCKLKSCISFQNQNKAILFYVFVFKIDFPF